MVSIRSPPYLLLVDIWIANKEEEMSKKYFIFIDGKKVYVSEEVYKGYWQITNRENYLEQVDRKNHLLFFSSYDKDGNFVDNLRDDKIDVEKIVETKLLIDRVRQALEALNIEERELIESLYFEEESIRSLARRLNTSHTSVIRKRNSVFKKLKGLLEDL